MISPDPAAVFRALDSGAVILNAENGDYFQLNATGRLLWESIESGATREEMVARLVDEFGAPKEDAARDVSEFLQALEERSLIEID